MLLLALFACAKTEIGVTPTLLDWGEVDFHAEMGESGYEPLPVSIVNTGDEPADIAIIGFPDDRLQLNVALLAGEDPPVLPTLAPFDTHVVTIGVKSYELTELTTLVEGSFTLSSDGMKDPVVVSWQYVPVRNQPVDTGI